jgi:hypothetical protein
VGEAIDPMVALGGILAVVMMFLITFRYVMPESLCGWWRKERRRESFS